MAGKFVPMEVRFWRHVSPEPNSGCWLWTGDMNRDGYGQICKPFDGRYSRRVNAHRFSYEMHNGPIPDGMLVCHKRKCNNRACVNPEHLYLGTQLDNMRDASALGMFRNRSYHNAAKGERHRSAKLKWSEVQWIRQEKATAGTLNKELAVRYGVSMPIISRIVNNQIWRAPA